MEQPKPRKRRMRRKPPPMGVRFVVRHPDSETEIPQSMITLPDGTRQCWHEYEGTKDSDGHTTDIYTEAWRGEALADVNVRHGIAPQSAAMVLRKIADLIERHGSVITQAKIGNIMHVKADGSIDLEDFDPFDANGNFKDEPPIFPLPEEQRPKTPEG